MSKITSAKKENTENNLPPKNNIFLLNSNERKAYEKSYLVPTIKKQTLKIKPKNVETFVKEDANKQIKVRGK